MRVGMLSKSIESLMSFQPVTGHFDICNYDQQLEKKKQC